MRLSQPQLFSERKKFPVLSRGFSLVELLVVLTILVAIAGIGVMHFGNIDTEQRTELTQIELAELAAAVKQFHTDTGFWPGYADLDNDGDTDEHTNPFDWSIITDTAYASWDAISKRGWRGPYISRLPADSFTVRAASEIDLSGFDEDESKSLADISANGVLTDPYGNAYALLASHRRNIILSVGPNGKFEILSRVCSSSPFDRDDCEREIYNHYCQNQPFADAPADSDDLAVCP